MSRTGYRVVVVALVVVGLVAVLVVPFLVIPAFVAGSLVLAIKLRIAHPDFSRASVLAGLSLALLAAAIAAIVVEAPQLIVTIILLSGSITYAGTVILAGRAWSRGSDHPKAIWITAVSLGLVGLLSVVLMGAFGRGIALADAGQSWWLVNALLLVSAIGIPTLLLVGLIAFLKTRQDLPPVSFAR
jgi:hypothetical protein